MKFEKSEINAATATPQEAETEFENAVKALIKKGLTVSVAESCTGGLIGKLFTDVSGASAVFAGGMITYTNHVKINKLGVSAETVAKYTEISFECAAEMAVRAREYFETDIGLSATGFAGPGGGNQNDPVGTVYLGFAGDDGICVYRLSFENATRSEIRYGTAKLVATLLK